MLVLGHQHDRREHTGHGAGRHYRRPHTHWET
jgi:hypothetical protein